MKYLLFSLILTTVFSACSKHDSGPSLSSLNPAKAGIGTIITLKGKGFGTNASIVNVLFNGTVATPITISDTLITVQVPPGATSGFVSVGINGMPKSNSQTLTLLSGTWVRKADLPFTSGRALAAAFAINGKGYFVGGTDNPTIFNDVYEYDPVADQWTKKSNTSGPFTERAACFVINNEAYVGISQIEGDYSNEWWEYDPPSDQWIRKADFPGPKGAGFSNFAVGNLGYVVAGNNDFWMYDPVADKWTQKTAPPTGVFYNSDASYFTIGSKAYTGTGLGGLQFWEYDATADTWNRKTDSPGNGYASGFAINNLGYVAGGEENWSFDPVNNSWSQVAFFVNDRIGGSTFVINGKAYFACGGNGQIGLVNEFWEFTP
jgi:N-acetylneuraminic acid mutarotase